MSGSRRVLHWTTIWLFLFAAFFRALAGDWWWAATHLLLASYAWQVYDQDRQIGHYRAALIRGDAR